MDDLLFHRAEDAGAQVIDGSSIVGLDSEDGYIKKFKLRSDDGQIVEIEADLFVDATGRRAIVSRLFEKSQSSRPTPMAKPKFVGFKAHLLETSMPRGVCEIYSFRDGYAGLGHVENGFVNLCFLIRADAVRATDKDPTEIMRNIVSGNRRAAETLRSAVPAGDWLAVAIDDFGTKSPVLAKNLFTVGDAAAFIDPFTGSGMVMALESAEILADVITEYGTDLDAIAREYPRRYGHKFMRRLQICSFLRRTAFMPLIATGVVSLLQTTSVGLRHLARATRR